jgi:hypothetical protein
VLHWLDNRGLQGSQGFFPGRSMGNAAENIRGNTPKKLANAFKPVG